MASGRYGQLFEESPVLRLLRRRNGTFLCDFLYRAFKGRDVIGSLGVFVQYRIGLETARVARH